MDGEIGPMTIEALDKAVAEMDAGKIKPNPTTVIVKPIEDEEPPDDGFEFHEGDIVNFIGNGHYFSPAAKFGFTCKPGRAMVRGLNRDPKAKHPYKVVAIRGGGSTVNGWVDTDAITAVD